MKPVALVTGASRGIGRAVAEYFARQGYRLILVARNAELLSDTADTLKASLDTEVQTLALDVGDSAAQEPINKAIEHWSRLDVLVNSAGIFRFGTAELSPEDMEAMLATNVVGAHRLCRQCLPWLKNSDRSHIFNLSSITGVETFAPVGGYCASKHALVGYGHSLAKESIAAGVRVTTLCPDVVDTDMGAPSGLEKDQMIAPEDICQSIDYVLSLSDAAVVDQIAIRCRTIMAREQHP